jgi:hypothetical protein
MSDEQGEKAPAVNTAHLALQAAVAMRVKDRVNALCDAVIAANNEHIKTTKGLRSTTAELPAEGDSDRAQPLVTFTRRYSKSSYSVADEDGLLEYADEQGETEYVVRPSFKAALLKRAQYDKDTGTVVDPATGAVLGFIAYDPGGELLGVSTRWANEGKDTVDAHLRPLDEALAAIPALGPGGSEEAGQ